MARLLVRFSLFTKISCHHTHHKDTIKLITMITPETMRAAQGADYGDIDKMITVQDGVKVPRLSDLPEKERKNAMVLKTLSVALAPGDCRVLSGKTRELQGPKTFPYIPGGDCVGIVVELPQDPEDDLPFKVGDRVAARFCGKNRDALGEYALVSTKVADKVPDEITADEAAALVGAAPATVLAERIQPGDRVLVFGARGGVGAHFCQVIREHGASLVVGVSKDAKALLDPPISCDKAFDYNKEDVYHLKEFQEDPFDVIVDLAGYGYSRLEQCVKEKTPLIVKTGAQNGRFITMVPPGGPLFEIHSFWQMTSVFIFPILWKTFVSRVFRSRQLPTYSFAFSLPSTRECVTRTFELAKEGKLKAVLDPSGPFKFTTEGVRSGFRVQESRHAQGKVVVHVADN